MKKVFIFLALIVLGLAIYFFVSLAPKRHVPTMELSLQQGYAPYKLSMHKNWVADNNKKAFVARREISPDLPKSMFELLVLDLLKTIGKSDITINDYVDKWWLAGFKYNDNPKILSIKDTSIDAFAAKDIICSYTLTHKNVTRELKCRWIIFIAGNYVYNFTLSSFPKDYDIANNEYERMVGSFKFDYSSAGIGKAVEGSNPSLTTSTLS